MVLADCGRVQPVADVCEIVQIRRSWEECGVRREQHAARAILATWSRRERQELIRVTCERNGDMTGVPVDRDTGGVREREPRNVRPACRADANREQEMFVLARDQQADVEAPEQPPEVAAHAVRETIADCERDDAGERNHLRWISDGSSVVFEQRQRVSSEHRQFAASGTVTGGGAWRTVRSRGEAPTAGWLWPCR